MKQLKQIKDNLKTNNELKRYKNIFKHRQMRFATTKIALIFNKNISAIKFYEIEKELINTPKDERMFKNAFLKMEKAINYKANWESLGKFMWYQYQASIYYKDIKNKTPNIFNKENMIKMNEIKRTFYSEWLHSLSKDDISFNKKIIQVSKIIL